MTDPYEPYTYTDDGTPVWLTEDGDLVDADGTEYEIAEDATEYAPDDYAAYESEHPAERYREDVVAQREQLERDLGRVLTPKETVKMADELIAQIERGETPDLAASHWEAGDHYDLDKRSDRTTYMEERLKPPPSEPEALAPLPLEATPSDRAAWMNARMAGAPLIDTEPEE